MKVTKEISNMLDGGWCSDCSEMLQRCLEEGRCLGNKFEGGENDVKNTV